MTARLPAAPLAAAALAAATVLALVAGGAGMGRTLVVLAFVLLAPGLGLVPLLGLRDRWAELTLALALSAALTTLVAGVLLAAGAWSPVRALVLLVDLTLLGAALQLLRGTTARRVLWALQAGVAVFWLAWVLAA